MFNPMTFMYDITSRLISYMKYSGADFIDKKLMIKIRDKYKLEYKAACKFYNSKIVKKFMKYSKVVLERDYERMLDDEDNKNNETILKNQHESLVRALNDSYNNLNLETIVKIINNVKNNDNQEYNLQLIIKGLISLQVIYNMKNIVNTTIENKGTYNHLTEYNNNLYFKVLEHINDYDYLINGYNNDLFFSKNLLESNKEVDTDDEEDNNKIFNPEKFYNDDLFKNNTSINPFEDISDNVDEFDDNDMDEIINNNDEFYSATNIDEYVYQLYYKQVIMMQSLIELLISNNYKLLPSNNYIMYWLIILLIHIVHKF